MPIRIPNDLPAAETLQQENIFVMPQTRAVSQDIRPLEIVLLNLMPTKIATETQLSRLLGNTPLQVNLELMHTSSHKAKNVSEDHLLSFYKTFDELKEKALTLPLAPGVYIMRDKTDKVIYVGKAKKLKNRVSQYFVNTVSHSPKTRLMVSHIDHFDVIVAASEFEALVLECSLIKRYLPKYNILLKDDKGYPYLQSWQSNRNAVL